MTPRGSILFTNRQTISHCYLSMDPHATIITTKYDVGSFLCSLTYPVLSSSFYKLLFHPFEHLRLYNALLVLQTIWQNAPLVMVYYYCINLKNTINKQ